MPSRTPYESIPGVGSPARRALQESGYPDLESLDGVDYLGLAGLHGVGKRALERLQVALVERGMSMAGEIPEPEPRRSTFTKGGTGRYSRDIKTRPTESRPRQFIEELESPRRVEHGRLLLETFNRVTGEEPVMWGPSMIGYGQVHYKYDSGREGDTFRVGFSPRCSKLSLYGLTGLPDSDEYLSRLGKYTTGKSCLYVNKPEDIDLDVLERLIAYAWDTEPGDHAG